MSCSSLHVSGLLQLGVSVRGKSRSSNRGRETVEKVVLIEALLHVMCLWKRLNKGCFFLSCISMKNSSFFVSLSGVFLEFMRISSCTNKWCGKVV